MKNNKLLIVFIIFFALMITISQIKITESEKSQNISLEVMQMQKNKLKQKFPEIKDSYVKFNEKDFEYEGYIIWNNNNISDKKINLLTDYFARITSFLQYEEKLKTNYYGKLWNFYNLKIIIKLKNNKEIIYEMKKGTHIIEKVKG